MMSPATPIRVSILERIVPSLAFIVTALSGALGGLMIFRFFNLLRQSESAGYFAMFSGVLEIEFAVAGVLVVATILCAIGILVSVIRLFTTNKTASPPGLLFLMTGLASIVPPFAIHYVLHLMKEVVRSPGMVEGGISGVASTVTAAAWFAIGSSIVITLLLLAFSFIPFSSRAGRKSSPLICLIFVAIVIAILAGIYFWEARTSITERNQHRDSYTSDETPSAIPDANTDSVSNTSDNTYYAAADTNSNRRPKTISGGVINSQAIELPQPEYPITARAVRATGAVSVKVLVDEKGEVVEASAVSGHPLLRSAAVQSARKAKFKPTLLSGTPVKVSGVITYNFVAQ